MVANNYLNEGIQNTEVVELTVLGFTGKLLVWWNNCLTEASKEDIKHAVQKDQDENPIFDERIGRGVPDAVNTLIYTIMKHFVGKPSNITSRIYDQLSNLRCKTLGEYGGMRMCSPLVSCIKAIVTLHFGRRSSSMDYLDYLVKRSKKPLVPF